MSLLVRAAAVLGSDARWLECREGEIVGMGAGRPPATDEVLDLRNCVAVPGLVNAHDHLYQWATRGYAADAGLFGWLQALYPLWAEIDAEAVHTAALVALERLLLAGCTLTTDHHYVFPRGRPGIFEALVAAAREVGIRFQPCRGSMSLGVSQGGLPPDDLVEDEDAILADTERLVATYHDPSPGAMCRVSVAPCSPFSVTEHLMRESADLARRLGVRLHTHLAETVDEERFCVEKFGRRPLELLEDLGWTGPDVWVAHGIHFSKPEIARLGSAGMGVAHCPSSNMRLGAGACPVSELRGAGVKVGLGVDGAASNEDYSLLREVHQALLLARVRASILSLPEPASALTPADAVDIATRGGAAALGRDDVGELAVGKRADIALYGVDADIDDWVAALVLAPPPRAEAVVVEGRIVVREGRLRTAGRDATTHA